MNLTAEAVVAEITLECNVVRASALLEHSYRSIVINNDKTQNSMLDSLSLSPLYYSLVAIRDGYFVSRRHVKLAEVTVGQVGCRSRIDRLIRRAGEDCIGVGEEIRRGKCGLENGRSR